MYIEPTINDNNTNCTMKVIPMGFWSIAGISCCYWWQNGGWVWNWPFSLMPFKNHGPSSDWLENMYRMWQV